MPEQAAIRSARRAFWALWAATAALRLLLAARLPLFVDEAFYWQEGRHPAWAYSDLPGLTAWLTRIGDALAPGSVFALRLPFLLVALALPGLVVAIARREAGARAGWQAGSLALLLPLAGSLGLLALPDVPLLLASLLCLDAALRLLRRITPAAAAELALGLVLGGLTHYRFGAVLAVGLLGLLLVREGRALLRAPWVWLALALGALAWAPLLGWNLQHAEAGLRFQLVDRHPWQFAAAAGLRLALWQLLPITPLLLVALAQAAWRGVRDPRPGPRLLALWGAGLVLGFVLLAFVADRERVSFHWPLPGVVALLPLVPAVLAGWPRLWRWLLWASTGAGLVLVLGYYALAASPALRAETARFNFHPTNFAGWQALAQAVQARLRTLPPGTRVLAGDFKLGAELGFALDDADLPVLEHPLNHKHGRAPQLALWGLLQPRRPASGPWLLVVDADSVPPRQLLAYYHRLCAQVGPLPPPQVVSVDHGRRRFLLFALAAGSAVGAGPCTAPALAFIDAPAAGAGVAPAFTVRGWAFKDGVGLRAVEILLDGRPWVRASYGQADPGVAAFWGISTDPQQPRVRFHAELAGVAPGRHWLGLRLHGRDGSVEDWPAQPLRVR